MTSSVDDYMVKPFSPKELEARIRCVLRRVGQSQAMAGSTARSGSNIVMIGGLSIDLNRRQVHRGSERIRLTGMEFSLLELLISRSDEPIHRLDILEQICGWRSLRRPPAAERGASALRASGSAPGCCSQTRSHGERPVAATPP